MSDRADRQPRPRGYCRWRQSARRPTQRGKAEVRDAYEIIGNDEKKKLYDVGGMGAVEAEAHKASQGGGMDPFSAFFGGGGGGRRGRNANKGPDASVEMAVSLAQLYSGATAGATIQRRVVCRGCRKSRKGKCAECGACPPETKMVQRQMGPGTFDNVVMPNAFRCNGCFARM